MSALALLEGESTDADDLIIYRACSASRERMIVIVIVGNETDRTIKD